MSKKNELSKKDAKKWANALRSGAYPQSVGRLQYLDGYCCLGVACEIFIPPSKQIREYGYLCGAMPWEQPDAPTWLAKLSDEFYNKSGGSSLVTFNDEAGFSFDEIADVIELVYVHKALD
jgi:hypothetical protein